MIKIIKNSPPRKKYKPLINYQKIIFRQKFSINILKEFFIEFPEEKRGRRKFKEKEINNTKILLYEEIICFAKNIKSNCIANLIEKVKGDTVSIQVSYFIKNEDK